MKPVLYRGQLVSPVSNGKASVTQQDTLMERHHIIQVSCSTVAFSMEIRDNLLLSVGFSTDFNGPLYPPPNQSQIPR